METEVKKPNYLNDREWKCLELYIKYQNARQAAEEAGYSRRSAAAQGSRLVNSEKGQRYLKKRYKQAGIENKTEIADASEILIYLTKTMRGELTDINQRTGCEQQAGLSIRTQAAGELAKRIMDNNVNNNITVTIIDDIPNTDIEDNIDEE